ncbi:MAG TPA: glycosyltransferase [Anaerolineae bacterium]|nr:glycosyltransferase [Anaerolineae bacterium]
MKIALVTPYDYPYPGGVTEHIRHLDREFRARGHETRILAASSAADENLEPHIIKVSGDVTPIPFNGSVARITLSPEVFERVGQILNEERFDVVHVHEPGVPLLSLAVLLHAPRHAINVGTFHAYQETNPMYEYARPLVEYLFSQLVGIVLLEAMAAGVPVVASDIAGYRSVLSQGEEGRLVKPKDEQAIAEAAIALLRDPRQRAEMGARGRTTAARYDWRVVAGRVLDYYGELRQARVSQPAQPSFRHHIAKQLALLTGGVSRILSPASGAITHPITRLG